MKIKTVVYFGIILGLFLLAACQGTSAEQTSPAEPAEPEATTVVPTEEPTAESTEAVAEEPAEAVVELVEDCFVDIPEGIDYDCGYVTVPEFHGVDNGNTIKLAVVRFWSPAENPADPIFFGAGGPGQSAIPRSAIVAVRLQYDDNLMKQVLAQHDLVYFSQRGTADSVPDLSCPILNAYGERVAAGNVTAEELRQLVSDALLECYANAVDSGVDFAAYNSLENAADINSIREALDYDQIIYYGESYGTLLGQHLLREYPESLSAVILDGTVPISVAIFEEKVDERFAHALEPLLDLCAADAACAEAFPTLAEDIETIYQQLEAEPYEMVTPSGFILPIDGVTFATDLFGSLYDPILSKNLPAVVDVLLNPSDDTELDQDVSRFLTSAIPGDGIAQLMHFAVTCAEDPITSVEEAKSLESPELSVYAAFAEADASDYVQMCSAMNLPVLPDETDELVSSDIPVLFLNGGLDPATPEYLAAPVADVLPNSYSFVFPYHGHVLGMNDSCSQSIVYQFIEDPLTEPDGSCIAEIEPPEFKLK